MVLILLEALGALLALVLIVWWTMFSGRSNGELPDLPQAKDGADSPPPERNTPADPGRGDGPPPRP
jgi:hypothetical protein